MLIKSPQKKLHTPVNITLCSNDGTSYSLQQKDHVKYLGVMIDDNLNWKYHISFICSRISRNTGIFYRLRYYLSPLQLRQIYYNLIYPYLSYAIVAWGSTYKSHLKGLQTKQNHIVRIVFFSTLYGQNTESALPLLNLLDLLTVDHIYELQALKFIHNWHKHQLPSNFDKYFQYAKNVHSYNTRYASNDNLYQARARTNTGKQAITFMASSLWQKLPLELKIVNGNIFCKKLKLHLLLVQNDLIH